VLLLFVEALLVSNGFKLESDSFSLCLMCLKEDNEVKRGLLWLKGRMLVLVFELEMFDVFSLGFMLLLKEDVDKVDLLREFVEKRYLGLLLLLLNLIRRINEGFDLWDRCFIREDVGFIWEELWELWSFGNLGMSLKNERSVVFVSFKSVLEFIVYGVNVKCHN
jgi:hypothetical protein